jgi:hypothetical protein
MYRKPKTTQEYRANESCPYVRAKRRNIPTWYDDLYAHPQKSWKVKRKTQYHPNKRGERHEMFLDRHYHIWYIKEYLENHHIPFRVEELLETGYNTYRKFKSVVYKTIPRFHYSCR